VLNYSETVPARNTTPSSIAVGDGVVMPLRKVKKHGV
jgi:hypothetical protein